MTNCQLTEEEYYSFISKLWPEEGMSKQVKIKLTDGELATYTNVLDIDWVIDAPDWLTLVCDQGVIRVSMTSIVAVEELFIE